ncbi:hypothetical protein GGI25_006289 [Coemansia spiralis]|uniref:FIST domain-containing protein n=2 Tax=Coemansia TaxID=4863 RepID=A0A9W8G0Y2_9FUNG|nr:hypothetical protein EDC05_005158 [Coemansia umbellata]KAJ2619857.1 hypothetical protein GGI26_005476 [Coemansia sp. RSA 1358]KAJ2668982.1 hypothetical protein GGI25_006289 [Coemansia spiralis]
MHGRQRLREVAVGRWHNKVTDRFKEQGLQSAQWISGTSTVTQATSHLVLPSELANSIDNPLLVEFVLFATDKESRQTLDLLDSHFPQALKIGIVGAQTPFLNGREYTLFSDSQVYDTGMVGFAFSRTEQSKDKRCAHHDSLHVAHNGLEPVSEVLRILRCKGNVILEVENGAAARSLLASVRSRRITRPGSAEESSRLYARIVPEKGSDQSMMCQVTGGDPAKGGLALDTLRDLSAGQYIQFMMTAAGTVIESKPDPCIAEDAGPNTVVCNHTGVSMQFGAADLLENSTKHHHYRYSPITKGNRRLLKPVFGGVTEGGFVYGRQSAEQPTSASKLSSYRSVFSGSVECSVPGSTVTLSLS